MNINGSRVNPAPIYIRVQQSTIQHYQVKSTVLKMSKVSMRYQNY